MVMYKCMKSLRNDNHNVYCNMPTCNNTYKRIWNFITALFIQLADEGFHFRFNILPFIHCNDDTFLVKH